MVFNSPDSRYHKGSFKTSPKPFSPSPGKKEYEKIALTKSDKKTKCTFINPKTGKHCEKYLGIYPEFCHIHTMLIENLCISKSQIKNAGNGLYAGPFGYSKGEIIGEYSTPFNYAKEGDIYKRNGKGENGYIEGYKPIDQSYLFCDAPKRGQSVEMSDCWDSLDIRSTIMRNANDGHNSKFRNNAYFEIKKKKGIKHVYIIASKKIKGYEEIYLDYGNDFW